MGRLHYSHEEAQAEATRLAEEFIADRPDRGQFRLHGAFPDTSVSPSRASKHPVAWVVVFDPIPQDGEVIDGGEIFVAVDLEFGTVKYLSWGVADAEQVAAAVTAATGS